MKKKILIFSIIAIIVLNIVFFIISKDDITKKNNLPEISDKDTNLIIEDENDKNNQVKVFSKEFKSYNFKKEKNKYTSNNMELEELFSAFYYEFFDKDYIYSDYSYNEEESKNIYFFKHKTKEDDIKQMTIQKDKDKYIIELID